MVYPKTLTDESHGASDLYVDYNYSNGNFYKANSSIIINGTTQNVWDFSSYPEDKSGLQPIAPTNLQVGNYNGHPFLWWQFNMANEYVTGFGIYRSHVYSGPPQGFYCIAIVSKSARSYIDETLTVGQGGIVYYKIIALNDDRHSDYSNIASINVIPRNIKDGNDLQAVAQVVNELSNNLRQNYPNPFNPLTKISYSIKDDTNVTLTIYDMLGREIDKVVNKFQFKGNYEVEFDGTNLPSGIYIYVLYTNTFQDIKKLLLIK